MTEPALVEHSLELPGEPQSAALARRAVGATLQRAGRPQWREAAELAVSEVVTNAILHARTHLDLAISVTPERVRVEVRDFSPALPIPRHYGPDATTGRGLALVAGVSSEYGVTRLGAAGKIVWFCVGAPQSAPD